MKKCTKCKDIKELAKFSKVKKAKDGFNNMCKACDKILYEKRKSRSKIIVQSILCRTCIVEKDTYMFRKDSRSINGYERICKLCKSLQKKIKKTDLIKWVNNLKSNTPCLDCGKIYEPHCMDYDHVRGVKVDHVSGMVQKIASKIRILAEVEKCDLVCLLCHNLRTKSRRPARKTNFCAERNIQIINEAKNKPCYICGEIRELCNMQFDHINPADKYRNICHLVGYKVETLLVEIAKCRVICALCHRRKSLSEQRNGYYPQYGERQRVVRSKLFIDWDNRTKECSMCHDILDFDAFIKRSRGVTGINSSCKKCTNRSKQEGRKKVKSGAITATTTSIITNNFAF